MSRSARKRQRVAEDDTAASCIIASDTALGRKCSQVLCEVLNISRVTHRVRKHSRATSIFFSSIPLVEAEIQGENRPVLPLPDGHRWIHVSIDLHWMEEKVWRVNHVSVGLLRGEPSIIQKTAILRAEWQFQHDPLLAGHAQPHWHVLRTNPGDGPLPRFDQVIEVAPGFQEFLESSTPAVAPDHAFDHFHYAMATDWHRSPSQGPFHALENESALLSWLEGCVSYIRHQLAHVDRKSIGTLA